MKILIIRHGEPDYSIDSLTEKGWREAELLADRLTQMDIRDFYVSPLGRAKDTAKPTLTRLHRTAEELTWLHEFRGQAVNPFTGEGSIPWNLSPRYFARQKELYDPENWRENAIYQAGTVGEIYDETAKGVDALLSRYGYTRDGRIYRTRQNSTDTIALFCHFALGMAIVSYLVGVSPSVMWHGFFLPTSSVTTFITEEREKGEVVFKCLQLGDTSHLYAGNEPVSRSGLFPETAEN